MTTPTNQIPQRLYPENPYLSLVDEDVTDICTVTHPTSPQQNVTIQPQSIIWDQDVPTDGVSWLWWKDNKGWFPYTQSQTSMIERAFVAGQSTIKLTGGYFTGKNYIINLNHMTQECLDNRALRKVKRIGPSTEGTTPDAAQALANNNFTDKQGAIDYSKKVQDLSVEALRRMRNIGLQISGGGVQKSQQNNNVTQSQPNGAWQWFGKQKWIAYDTEIQTILENKYMQNETLVKLDSCISKYGPYTINLVDMTQTNAMGKVRHIRRDYNYKL